MTELCDDITFETDKATVDIWEKDLNRLSP
jgi:hypothetical protein